MSVSEEQTASGTILVKTTQETSDAQPLHAVIDARVSSQDHKKDLDAQFYLLKYDSSVKIRCVSQRGGSDGSKSGVYVGHGSYELGYPERHDPSSGSRVSDRPKRLGFFRKFVRAYCKSGAWSYSCHL